MMSLRHRHGPTGPASSALPVPRRAARAAALALLLGALLPGALLPGALLPSELHAQVPPALSGELTISTAERAAGMAADSVVPPLAPLLAFRTSELEPIVSRFMADRAALNRRYDTPTAAQRRARLASFYDAWQRRLDELDYDGLGREAKIDYILLRNRVTYDRSVLAREEHALAEMRPLLPFIEPVVALHVSWRDRQPVDARAAADALFHVTRRIEQARAGLGDVTGSVTPIVALRATETLQSLRRAIGAWHDFYAGYDPNFTWWVGEPYARFDRALDGYIRQVNERIVGMRPGEPEPIIGDPIGAAGLADDLVLEMLPYTPAELIAIAERELAWGENEMRRAARELGYGDDWHAALEYVKQRHVEPGRQPELVAFLAQEAEDFLDAGGYLTIPPLAREVWRMTMLSPERQRIAPFFLGGEVVQIAYPTDAMAHEDKLMSMRGNNEHFSRAVVHHELIPGHHLQGFMTQRYNAHRGAFSTPFWGEGWALYWEMQLWDRGFPQSPEDRIGMLLWRNHRAARIIFSLGFHLGEMTPQEAVDFLVARVGHERANAEAEVRRSFAGAYSPLYQAAYMIGGLQLRELYRELVESGQIGEADFHDAVLQGGRIPIEMVRARLTDAPLPRDYRAHWRFYGDPRRPRS